MYKRHVSWQGIIDPLMLLRACGQRVVYRQILSLFDYLYVSFHQYELPTTLASSQHSATRTCPRVHLSVAQNLRLRRIPHENPSVRIRAEGIIH